MTLSKNVSIEYLNTLNYNIIDNGRIVIIDSIPSIENKLYKTKLFNTRIVRNDTSTLTQQQLDWIEASKLDSSASKFLFDTFPWDGGTMIELQDAYPNEPQKYDYVEINNGGYALDKRELSFDGEQWGYAQEYHDGVEPLFDLFDHNGISFASKSTYSNSGFVGEKVFSYKSGPTYDYILKSSVEKNEYNNFVFVDNLSNPFLYKSAKYNKYVAIVDGIKFDYTNHWHLSNYSLEEKSNNIYEVHSSIHANPFNTNIVEITKNYWLGQFASLRQNQNWNSHSKGINYSAGSKIKQHRNSSLLAMSLVTNGVDFLEALKYSEKEYFKFYNKFVTKLKYIDETVGLPSLTAIDKHFVVDVLRKISATKNDTHPYFDNTVEKLGTFIPNTPAYLGITRLYTPLKTADQVVGHDGSIYRKDTTIDPVVANLILHSVYVLENTIFNEAILHGASLEKYSFDFNEIISYPYDNSKEYSYYDFVAAASQFFIRWTSTKDIDFHINSTYDPSNEFSYNYSNSINVLNRKLPGGYRGMYKVLFRTDTPNTTPWEILGLYTKPIWWDSVYSWTDNTKRSALISAIKTGLTSNPVSTTKTYTTPIAYIETITPVNKDGNLLSPLEAKIISKSSSDNFSGLWAFGDYGPVEHSFWKSKESSFALCGTAYVMKPSKLISGSWLCGDEIYKNGQWTKQTNGSREFDKNQSIHGELIDNQHITKYGVQTIISDYQKSLGMNITTSLGDVVRNAETKLIHKLGGFVFDDLSLYSDSSGVIPKNNYTTILHTSPPKSEYYYSAVIVEKRQSSYAIYGYNPINPSFQAYLVNDNGPALPVSTEPYPVPADWVRQTDYRKGNRAKRGNRIYRCVTSHNSANKFDIKYWNIIKIISSSNTDLKWYYDYEDQPIKQYDYGHEFVELQEVVNFLSGYQHYLNSVGFSFNRVDPITNSRYDFKFLVESLIEFDNKELSPDSEHNQIIALSPGSEQIDFSFDFGFVEQVNVSRNGLYGILDYYGRSISNKNIEISRTQNNFVIKTKNDVGINGLRLGLKESEHVLILDNVTSFGDIVYDSTYDIRQERIRISCTTADNWDGTINADGVIIIDGIAKPNFESKAEELRNLYTSDMSGNTQISNMVKHTIGYKDRSYLDELMMNNQNKFEFYQGMIQHKGTPTVHNRLLRSERLVQNKNIKFAEEWAFNIARYGNISSAKNLDISINAEDIVTNDILVTLETLNNAMTPSELSALDTDNTAVTLFSNQTAIDSRIKTGLDSSLLPTKNMYQSDEIISAGYIFEDDFVYSIISDTYFNQWYKNVDEEITTNTTIHIVNPRQFTLNNSIVVDKNLTLIASSLTYQLSETVIDSDGVELVIGEHALLPGDFVYIDKSAMADNEYFGIYPVVSITNSSVIINGEDNDYLYKEIKPTVRLLSRTSVKFAPTVSNSSHVKTNVLYPVALSVDSEVLGYYLELVNTPTTKTTYPHIRCALVDKMIIYVECGFSKNSFELLPNDVPRWAVFQYDVVAGVFNNIGIQQYKLNIDNLIDIQVYRDSAKLDTENKILEDVQLMSDHTMVLDIGNGNIPGVLDKDIDFISPIDPCNYSEWDFTQHGKYWIDSSKFAYYNSNTRLSYTISNCKALQSKLGKLVKGSEITIYKWTISEKIPALYDGQGKFYNPDYYTVWDNNGIIYYGFWVKDSLEVPKTKSLSTTVIADYLRNLMTSGFSMLIPLHKNGFVVTGLNKYLNKDSFIRLKLDSGKDTQKFSEWILMRSDDRTSLPPDELWNSLVYSLAGKTIERNPLPNPLLTSIDRYGCDYNSGQTWFKNLPKARTYAMQSLNRIFNRGNLLNDRMSIASLYASDISMHLEWVKNGNHSFKFYPSPKLYTNGPISNIADIPGYYGGKTLLVQKDGTEFWRVIESSSKYRALMYNRVIANTSEIVQSDLNSPILLRQPNQLDKIIKPVYAYPDRYWIDPTLTFNTVFTQEVKTENVLKIVDWYADGYNKTMAPIFVDPNTFPISWAEVGSPSFVKTIVNDKWVWLENKTSYWEVVAAESGTFNTIDWNSSSDNSLNIGILLGLIRDNVFTNAELNEFFFDMVKYVLSEQNSVHWFFKTSYMHISGYAATMDKTPVKTKDAIESLIEYINEVKPYRVKVRDYTSVYDTYCGSFKVKLGNETVKHTQYKALRSAYDKLPFDVFYLGLNTNIDWYVRADDNKVYWVMYQTTDGNFISQELNGNYRSFAKNELNSFTQVDDYDYPFVDMYLPKIFYKQYGINLKSRLYRLVLRNQVSNELQSQITTSGITFT
jgi:hypothetical protein